VKEKITEILLLLLKEIIQMNGLPVTEEINEESRIIGKQGVLDSLAFVSFLVAAEQKINNEFNKKASLTSEKAFSEGRNPFRTVKSLAEYIEAIW